MAPRRTTMDQTYSRILMRAWPIAAAIAVAGCDSTCVNGAGQAVPSYLIPRDTTVGVGQSFTLRLFSPHGSTCGSAAQPDTTAAPHSVRSSNADVIAVDSMTGRVTALAPGDAMVFSYDSSTSLPQVHVR